MVRQMFQMAVEGQPCSAIAKAMEQAQVLTPQAYLHEKFGMFASEAALQLPYRWDAHTVRGILANQLYLGNMVHFRTKTKSFKDKTLVYRPEEEWVIVPNTHEAIIDEQTFRTVQERLKVKQPTPHRHPDNIYRGLMICGECGRRMAFGARKGRKIKGCYTCNRNKRYGGRLCSTHYITVEQINAVVLEDIRRHASLAAADAETYAAYLAELDKQGRHCDMADRKKELAAAQTRLGQLDTLIQKIYEDNAFGKLSDERYETMAATYEAEAKQLKTRTKELQGQLAEDREQARDAERFARLIAQYTDITELTEELVHTLIERIVVHEKEMIDGRQTMRIEIYYRFIGNVSGERGLQAPKGGRKIA